MSGERSSRAAGIERIVSAAGRLPDRFLHVGRVASERDVPRFSLDILLGLADEAPYGDGERTVRDPSVRRCLQVDAARLREVAPSLEGWSGLGEALRRVSVDLTPGVMLDAVLDKVLVYRPGDFFREHRDAKKDRRHVMTMSVICETGDMAGGGGAVRFFRRPVGSPLYEEVARFEGRAPGDYACWFNGELHDVSPVEGGYRVVLQYTVTAVGRVQYHPAASFPMSGGELGGGAASHVSQFLTCEEQRNLSETCRALRPLNDPLALYTKLVREHASDIHKELGQKGLGQLGFFLRNKYSLDNEATVDPLHLRGADAVTMAALSEVFPRCRLSVSRAHLLGAIYERDDDDGYNWAEEWLDSGDNDNDSHDSHVPGSSEIMEQLNNLTVVHEMTLGNPCQNGNDYGTRSAVRSELRHLLPAGKTHIRDDVLWKMECPVDVEDDTERERFHWPFFRTLFVLREFDKGFIGDKVKPGFEDSYRWGNAAHFRIYWYESVAFLLTLEGGQGETRSDEVEMDDWTQVLLISEPNGVETNQT